VRCATVPAYDCGLKQNAASGLLMSNEELQKQDFKWEADWLHFLTAKTNGFQ